MSPKKIGKAVLCRSLEKQVKKLRRHNNFQLVAVAGSVGKTSTKLAIAKTLAGTKRVIYQDGNYNDRLTVPLILFGQTEPGIFNLVGWLKILAAARRIARQPYPYDVAVVELGADAPGQLAKFAYLQPDICVITAVADEHMESFGNLDRVAAEELSPLNFSKKVLLNTDDIAQQYLPQTPHLSYGLQAADYTAAERQPLPELRGQHIKFGLPEGRSLAADVSTLGVQGAKITVAAVAVADQLDVPSAEIGKSLPAIQPVAGRLRVLPGIQNSTIIDDTYNASPLAVRAALDVLYSVNAAQRIAILGSMNELGADSARMHQEIGALCDPQKLNLVVTIGTEAKQYLAPAAAAKGCVVEACDSPQQAGEIVSQRMKPGAVILAKGSQNGVFAEEALKPLLANPADGQQLVRQSAYWLRVKQHQFPDLRAKASLTK